MRTSRSAALASLLIVGVGCSEKTITAVSPGDLSSAAPSAAFNTWAPGKTDTCTPDVHNRFSTVGPDGKKYPTWHPPVDPLTGCTFGHEHGRDPHGSNLYAEVGDIPFGYANEQLDVSNLNMVRHEDHFGHKVEWENDMRIQVGGGIEVRCDILAKLHQGTHSKDAFTNNLHELVYHIRCSDKTEMHITLLSAIGRPGEFNSSCGGTIQAGTASPANAPNGGGQRRIPDAACVVPRILVAAGQQSDFNNLHESWETSNEVRTAEGRRLAFFNPYFQVFRPSRYYDPAVIGVVGRPVALCALTSGDLRARGNECTGMTSTVNNVLVAIDYDNSISGFNGVHRQMDVNNNALSNAGGPAVWYSDPFGNNARTTPFTGSIRQFIAAINNDYGVSVNGPAIGGDRNYGGTGVRAPN